MLKHWVAPFYMQWGGELWWSDVVAGQSTDCPAEPMDAEDMLYVLYTSGSTGKPKGIIHTTGGYMVGTYLTAKYVFDLQENDIFWCTADIGWVTGHSYVVYGMLSNGATCLMYEGAPNFPDFARFWSSRRTPWAKITRPDAPSRSRTAARVVTRDEGVPA